MVRAECEGRSGLAMYFLKRSAADYERSLPSAIRSKRMANTKSAKKATRVIARRAEVNKARRTHMRTYLRVVEEAIAAGDAKKADAALKAAEPKIMQAAQKGVIHRNTASRKVARLAKRVRKLAG